MTVMEDGATVVQAKRFDPRVTRLGGSSVEAASTRFRNSSTF